MVCSTERTTLGLSWYRAMTSCPTASTRTSALFSREAMCGFRMVRLAKRPKPCSQMGALSRCERTAATQRKARSLSMATSSFSSSEKASALVTARPARTTRASPSASAASTVRRSLAPFGPSASSWMRSSRQASSRSSSSACSRSRAAQRPAASQRSAVSTAWRYSGKCSSRTARSRFSTAEGTQLAWRGSSSLSSVRSAAQALVCTEGDAGKRRSAASSRSRPPACSGSLKRGVR
mmetsp:Transcript_19711/g.41005  ORF Transcript_19711/g.41005 Transcript_19711/m.41005 type:complete len:236 (+) Transcript_19711:195-902(+)